MKLSPTAIADLCRSLGLAVLLEPATGRRCYSATDGRGIRVYWTVSLKGGLLGLPRVINRGVDTHAKSLREVRYLIRA